MMSDASEGVKSPPAESFQVDALDIVLTGNIHITGDLMVDGMTEFMEDITVDEVGFLTHTHAETGGETFPPTKGENHMPMRYRNKYKRRKSLYQKKKDSKI
jgi:hypothetical protein